MEHPVEQRLHLEGLERRSQREQARRNASQVGRGPARRGLAGERAEVALAVGLEFDAFAKLVGEIERVGEQALVHRD